MEGDLAGLTVSRLRPQLLVPRRWTDHPRVLCWRRPRLFSRSLRCTTAHCAARVEHGVHDLRRDIFGLLVPFSGAKPLEKQCNNVTFRD